MLACRIREVLTSYVESSGHLDILCEGIGE